MVRKKKKQRSWSYVPYVLVVVVRVTVWLQRFGYHVEFHKGHGQLQI